MNYKRNPNITYFAKTDFRDQKDVFGIWQTDRAFHTYILGKTGTGKTNLLLTKIVQDIQANRGLCIFDVHGDLLNTTRKHIPHHRKNDLIDINIADSNLTIGYNPLKRVSYEKRSLVASGILDSFEKLWGAAWGMKMEHILRYILLTLLDQPKANLRDIINIIHNAEYRKLCVKNIINPDVKSFWVKEFPKYGKADLMPILNKVGAFLVHPRIKKFLVENPDNLSLRRCMDNKKIVLISLNKGSIGADVAHVLGSLLLTSITSASFSRIDTLESRRVPFHVYLDEFQNYTNKTLVEQLSELRKFKIILTLAHQYIQQLDAEIRNGVFGNVGTIICFRVGAVDAEYMIKELFKEYLPITIGDYVNLPNHHVYMKMMIDGKPTTRPFSAITLYYKEFLCPKFNSIMD